MKTTGLYDGKELLYDKFRPGYPREIISLLKPSQRSNVNSVIDMGAGTGRLSELFLKQGMKVTGIEPNLKMVKMMQHKFESNDFFSAIQNTSENTGLSDNCADLVSFGQSFHWCDNDSTIKEVKRILKPNGDVLICWNHRNEKRDEFNRQLELLLLKLFPVYQTNKEVHYDAEQLKALFKSDTIRREEFHHNQQLDLNGVIGRFESNSYFGESKRSEFYSEVKELFKQWQSNGFIELSYTCEVFLLNFKS